MTVGLLSVSASPLNVGKAQLNVGFNDITSGWLWMNVLKASVSYAFDIGCNPSQTDIYGFPIATIPASISAVCGMPGLTGPWVFSWPAGRTFSFTLVQVCTVNSGASSFPAGSSFSGGSNSSLTITSTGVAGFCVFSFTNPITTLNWHFPAGASYAPGSGEVSLVLQSNLTAFQAGKTLTPEFTAAAKALKPRTIRTMGWTFAFGQFNNEGDWRYRIQPQGITWASPHWAPNAWAGGAGGSGAITGVTPSFSCAATADSPGGAWPDGMTVQGIQANSPSPSLNITAIADNGSGKCRLTTGNSGLKSTTTASFTNGQSVLISSATGTTGLNGVQTITIVDATHIDVSAVAFVATGTGNIDTRILVTGAANNGSGLVRLTVNMTANITTNQHVIVSNVQGTLEANGNWQITVIDATHIDLQGSSFSRSYTSSGVVGTDTLTVSGMSGAKLLISQNGFPPQGGLGSGDRVDTINENSLVTYTYNQIMDCVVYTSGSSLSSNIAQDGGLIAMVPMETQTAMCNELNCYLWSNSGIYMNSTYLTNWATSAKNGLNSNLNFYEEPGNEVWNFFGAGFGISQTMNQFGIRLVGPTGSWDDAYALKAALQHNLCTAAWSGSTSRLRRVSAIQLAPAYLGAGGNISSRWNGQNLVAGVTSIYNTVTGSTSYNVSPNRPIDVTDVPSYAPYQVSTNLNFDGVVGSDYDLTNMSLAATNWNSGVSAQQQAAIAWFDADARAGLRSPFTVTSVSGVTINAAGHTFTNGTTVAFRNTGGALPTGLDATRIYSVANVVAGVSFEARLFVGTGTGASVSVSGGSGTTSVGVILNQTLIGLNNLFYQAGELLAASYDSGRAVPLAWECYEGGASIVPPTAAQCAAIGLTATPVGGGAATNASAASGLLATLIAWRNSSMGRQFVKDYFNQFVGLYPGLFDSGALPHSMTPSYLNLTGSGDGSGTGTQWALLPGTVATPLTAYQLYNGFQDYSVS